MGKNSKRIRVFNIDWDVDDKKDLENLPTEVRCIVFNGADVENIDNQDEVEDYLSEKLSDDYGFCHNGFDYEEY